MKYLLSLLLGLFFVNSLFAAISSESLMNPVEWSCNRTPHERERIVVSARDSNGVSETPCRIEEECLLSEELIGLKAVLIGSVAKISWSTFSEVNNAYFSIERSEDAVFWTEIKRVKGGGTSTSIINYFEVDEEPLSGIFYYRIRQVNFNGTAGSFDVISVEKNREFNQIMNVFSNPIQKGERIIISFKISETNDTEDKEILIVMRDIKGNEIYSKTEFVNPRQGLVTITKTDHLTAGIYFISANKENHRYSQRIRVL